MTRVLTGQDETARRGDPLDVPTTLTCDERGSRDGGGRRPPQHQCRTGALEVPATAESPKTTPNFWETQIEIIRTSR